VEAAGLSRARLFCWTAAMVLAGALVPAFAQALGMHLAGTAWNALRLTAPFLSQVGTLAGGLLGGAIVGLLQWAPLPATSARWIAIATVAGLFVALVYLVYQPLTVIAAPVAGAVAAVFQSRLVKIPGQRWVRAQAISAAWVALAILLPFPAWAAAGFIVGAALFSAWGIRAGFVEARA
jgi:hypothetical protein